MPLPLPDIATTRYGRANACSARSQSDQQAVRLPLDVAIKSELTIRGLIQEIENEWKLFLLAADNYRVMVEA